MGYANPQLKGKIQRFMDQIHFGRIRQSWMLQLRSVEVAEDWLKVRAGVANQTRESTLRRVEDFMVQRKLLIQLCVEWNS